MTSPSKLAGLTLAFTASCMTRGVHVSIDARARPGEPSQFKYALLPANEGESEESFDFQDFGAVLEWSLAERGFERVPVEQAEVLVFFGYELGEGKTVNYSVPVWGKTGYSSSQTYGSFNTYSGTYTGTTYYNPTYGVTGYRSASAHVYPRTFVVVAFAARDETDNKDPQPLWQTTACSVGSSSDLRKVIPLMVFASKDLLATDSRERVERSISLESSECEAWIADHRMASSGAAISDDQPDP